MCAVYCLYSKVAYQSHIIVGPTVADMYMHCFLHHKKFDLAITCSSRRLLNIRMLKDVHTPQLLTALHDMSFVVAV